MKNLLKEELELAVASSISIAETLRKLGFSTGAANYRSLHKLLKLYSISIEHFLGLAHNKGKYFGPKRDIEDYLNGTQRINSHALRQKLIKRGIKQHKCEICGITEWCGKPTPVELDHIDGNNENNQLSNLRIICPNCHAQTDHYRGRNTQYHKKLKESQCYCKCGKLKYKNSKLCRECNGKLPKYYCRKVDRPKQDKLLELIKTTPFIKIGKMYGVTDNTVRKWCKSYGLPYKKKDITKMKKDLTNVAG